MHNDKRCRKMFTRKFPSIWRSEWFSQFSCAYMFLFHLLIRLSITSNVICCLLLKTSHSLSAESSKFYRLTNRAKQKMRRGWTDIGSVGSQNLYIHQSFSYNSIISSLVSVETTTATHKKNVFSCRAYVWSGSIWRGHVLIIEKRKRSVVRQQENFCDFIRQVNSNTEHKIDPILISHLKSRYYQFNLSFKIDNNYVELHGL